MLNSLPRLFFLFLFWLLAFSFCFSQSRQVREIDSLKQLLKVAKEDTGKVKALNDLGRKLKLTGQFDTV
jgi:hypothetical protein